MLQAHGVSDKLHSDDNAAICEQVIHLVEDEPAAAHVLHGPYLEMSGGPCGIVIRQPACCTLVSNVCCVYDKDSTLPAPNMTKQ